MIDSNDDDDDGDDDDGDDNDMMSIGCCSFHNNIFKVYISFFFSQIFLKNLDLGLSGADC